MSALFDLEQKILECWNITTDLETIQKHVANRSGDVITKEEVNKIVGAVEVLYDLKFESLFALFEQHSKELYDQRNRLAANEAQRTDRTMF
jgi:hypothetical protein